MTKLALTFPWSDAARETVINPANIPTNNEFPADQFQLAKAINSFGEVAIFVGAFLMFFWAAWGVFDYIRAEGNKEALAKARKRIQWAIAGFVILILAFFMSNLVKYILFRGQDLGQFGITEVIIP
jgi:hypothetical protein